MQWNDERERDPWLTSTLKLVGVLVVAILIAGSCEVRANPDTGDHYAGFYLSASFGLGPETVETRDGFSPVANVPLEFEQERVVSATMLGRISDSATFLIGVSGVFSGEREIQARGSVYTPSPEGFIDTSRWRVALGLRWYVGKR